MGKLNHGPVSRAIGKAGGFVYQQYEGMQVFREYQPNVKNPQTESQMSNRSVFKLASQFTALWFPILGLAKYDTTYKRMKRATIVKLSMANANKVEMGEGSYINGQAVVSALNLRSDAQYGTITITATSATQTIAASFPNDGNLRTLHIEVVAFDENDSILGKNVYTQTPQAGTAVNIVLPVVKGTPVYYQVSAIMLTAVSEEGRATLSRMYLYNDDQLSGTMLYSNNIDRAITVGDIVPSPIDIADWSTE